MCQLVHNVSSSFWYAFWYEKFRTHKCFADLIPEKTTSTNEPLKGKDYYAVHLNKRSL